MNLLALCSVGYSCSELLHFGLTGSSIAESSHSLGYCSRIVAGYTVAGRTAVGRTTVGHTTADRIGSIADHILNHIAVDHTTTGHSCTVADHSSGIAAVAIIHRMQSSTAFDRLSQLPYCLALVSLSDYHLILPSQMLHRNFVPLTRSNSKSCFISSSNLHFESDFNFDLN